LSQVSDRQTVGRAVLSSQFESI